MARLQNSQRYLGMVGGEVIYDYFCLVLRSNENRKTFCRMVESNLYLALVEITNDIGDIESHYDKDSGMRNQSLVKDLINGAKFLDEQDVEGLNVYLIDHKVLIVWNSPFIFTLSIQFALISGLQRN